MSIMPVVYNRCSRFSLVGRRGTSLVDVMFATFLLGLAGAVFAATFPMGITCTRRAREMKTATAIAQQKVEQLRGVNYESLTSPLLLSAGLVDSGSDSSEYSFTTVDTVASKLGHGTGGIVITDKAADIKQIVVTVSWKESASNVSRNVILRTYIADKRTRPAS